MTFTYHPDGHIYVNSKHSGTFEDFMASNPRFPLTRGEYFDYRNEKYHTINSEGHNLPAYPAEGLVEAIKSLGEK